MLVFASGTISASVWKKKNKVSWVRLKSPLQLLGGLALCSDPRPRGAESEEREGKQTALYCAAISRTASVSTPVPSTIPSEPFTPVKRPEPKSVRFI